MSRPTVGNLPFKRAWRGQVGEIQTTASAIPAPIRGLRLSSNSDQPPTLLLNEQFAARLAEPRAAYSNPSINRSVLFPIAERSWRIHSMALAEATEEPSNFMTITFATFATLRKRVAGAAARGRIVQFIRRPDIPQQQGTYYPYTFVMFGLQNLAGRVIPEQTE